MGDILNWVIIFGAKYLIFLIIILAIWCFMKQPKDIRKEMFIFGIITFPIIFIIARISSYFYFNPRPFVVGNFTPLIAHDATNGFPSDHTLLSSAVSMLIYYFNKKIGIILLFLTFIVGLSRVLAGVHHFVDIMGSVTISIFVAYIAYTYFFEITKRVFAKK